MRLPPCVAGITERAEYEEPNNLPGHTGRAAQGGHTQRREPTRPKRTAQMRVPVAGWNLDL